MIARDRRRGWVAVTAAAMIGSAGMAGAQDGRVPIQTNKPKTAATAPAAKPTAPPESRLVRVPVNPTDAVAIVNGEPITRQALSEETLIRKGEEVLDALVSRKLIEQAVRAKKIVITQQEVEADIDHAAATIGGGVSREEWLRLLSSKRKISPSQYAKDIIYPGLALKKLAQDRVTVTDQDRKDAFDAHFGEKLRCRIIMTATQRDAIAIFNELQKNPDGFEYTAQNDPRSMDEVTKANGGLLIDPLTRHAYPREVSDKAFEQLVDGNPKDNDPKHKPQDGTMTGPIQVNETAWILMKRESLIPATPHDPKDAAASKQFEAMIYDAKLKEAMSEVFQEIMDGAAVENKLTGQVKLAHEANRPESLVDEKVNLMSNPGGAIPNRQPAASVPVAQSKAVNAAVNPEDRAAADAMRKAITDPKSKPAPK